jgi:nitronate monooxygenase
VTALAAGRHRGPRARAEEFCSRYGLRVPILQAPMSGASPPELGIAVAEAGGMAARGSLLDTPERIAEWFRRFRSGSGGAVQVNTWIPDTPTDDRQRITDARVFLARFGVPGDHADAGRDPAALFEQQCEAMLAAGPTAVSSIMGLFGPGYVDRLHRAGIAWFACATTLDDALAAQDAGADAVVAQGLEAGGHRGTFEPDAAESVEVGLFALLPRLSDHLQVPVIAAGGIADGRGVAAALTLGASAVQIGTALLRCPETGADTEWAASLAGLAPEATITTRAYSGRLGRTAPTPYVRAWRAADAPRPAPYPQQRQLLSQWRAGAAPGLERVSYWAGQSAAMATDAPAGEVITAMWKDASALLA